MKSEWETTKQKMLGHISSFYGFRNIDTTLWLLTCAIGRARARNTNTPFLNVVSRFCYKHLDIRKVKDV